MSQHKDIDFPAGMHIADAAALLVREAAAAGCDAVARFNDIPLRARPGQEASVVLAEYEQKVADRGARWRASPEGRAQAEARASEVATLQALADAMTAGVEGLDFADRAAVLEWLGDIQPSSDRLGVTIDAQRILAAFANHDLVPNMRTGDAFDENDPGIYFEWLVGQALDGLAKGPSIHGVFHSFAAEWKRKWGGEPCIACAKTMVDGDRYYSDASGGFIHADCCGPERESYTGADGEPLKDGEPIPGPSIWGAD